MGTRGLLPRLFASILLALAVPACGGGGGAGPEGVPPPPPPEPVPLATRSYEGTAEIFPNPERGFYEWIDLVLGRDFRPLLARGHTLGLANVSLAAYRAGDLPSAFLENLRAGLAAARESGIKVILRFKYADWLGAPDAPKARILAHIHQLGPLLQENADVIAVMQAGFIGAWGEWHESTHGLENPVDQGEVLRALLEALPRERMVQVRTPYFKQGIFGSEPLAPVEAFSGADRARTGHHNDAFLASDTDKGTYLGDIEGLKNYVAAESRFVPVGGECNTYNPPRTDGPNAAAEMARFRYSFLNRYYKWPLPAYWEQQGYIEVFGRHLGYRFALVEASWPEALKPGGVLELHGTIRNDGYAAPFNPRPAYAVLAGPEGWHAVRLGSVDPRRWAPGGESTFQTRLRIPADLPAGAYRLALWLPDPAWTLQSRPEYAVRFANAGVWDSGSGLNVLTESFRVDPAAPGPADPYAAGFEEIP